MIHPIHLHLYDGSSGDYFASVRMKSLGDAAVRAARLALERGRVSPDELLTLLGLEATTEPPPGSDRFSGIRE